MLFAVELVLLLTAFRLRFSGHLEYVVDMLDVSACFYQDVAGLGKGKMMEVIMLLLLSGPYRVMSTAHKRVDMNFQWLCVRVCVQLHIITQPGPDILIFQYRHVCLCDLGVRGWV